MHNDDTHTFIEIFWDSQLETSRKEDETVTCKSQEPAQIKLIRDLHESKKSFKSFKSSQQ